MFRCMALLGVMLLAQAVPSSCDVPPINLNVTVQEAQTAGEANQADDPQSTASPASSFDDPVSDTSRPVGANANPGAPGTGTTPSGNATTSAEEPTDADGGTSDGSDPAAGPRTGTVFGQVRGVSDDPAGTPLAGAHVALIAPNGVFRDTLTNNEGRYVFEQVPVGHYGMLAKAEHYLPGPAQVDVVADQRTEQNFLLRREPRFGAIFGHVGGGEGEDRFPIPGARVRLIHEGNPVAQTETDNLGRYAFPHVLPGVYAMAVTKEGFNPAGARDVAVRPDERTEQNFQLERNHDNDGAIFGRVGTREGDGNVVPVAGAHLRLMRGNHEVGRTETNERGEYGFPNLQPGLYLIQVAADGFLPEEARVIVHPRTREEQNFLLRRPEPGAVFGHVGRMGDNGPVPIAGALVKLMQEGQVLRETRTNETGLYVFEMVRPGIYGVGAGFEGCRTRIERVEVHPGQRVEQNFLLECENAQHGAVFGHVARMGDNGPVPIVGAVVRLAREGAILRETRTNETGLYAFELVPPGLYGVIAAADHCTPQEAEVTVVDGQRTQQDFLLECGGNDDRGGIAGVVAGIGNDGALHPIPGAIVRLLAGDGSVLREVPTDNSGHYGIPGVPAGEYDMVAGAEGWIPGEAHVVVAAGAVTEQDFELQHRPPPGAVIGNVSGEREGRVAPIGGASVRLIQNNAVLREVFTGPLGNYEMGQIPPGEYEVAAGAPGWQPQLVHVTVTSGPPPTVQNFVLQPE